MILRLSKFAVFVCLIQVLSLSSVVADTTSAEVYELFPERVGTFRRVGIPGPVDSTKQPEPIKFATLAGAGEYTGSGGQKFQVEVVRFRQDSEAYSLLTHVLASNSQGVALLGSKIGTSGFSNDRELWFFKGVHFVRITSLSNAATSGREAFATALAETYDKGEGDIPALVKHLPNPEQLQYRALFLPRFTNLQQLAPNHGVLSAVQTNGDGDAAFVDSGSGKVLVIEYNTPQLAKDNDERIIARIRELWKLGQAAPSAYRRVGNYSVFVFDSPDEASAKSLIDQVKYEQVVQWLGTNPYIYKAAEKEYVETTLGVFVAVIKASGYALVGCLALGGLLGGLLFFRRKTQRGALETYSDAGGMLRLNLDDLTSPQTDPRRLIGPGH